MNVGTIITVKGVLERCTVTSEDGDKYIIQRFDDGLVCTGFFMLMKLSRWWRIIKILEVKK